MSGRWAGWLRLLCTVSVCCRRLHCGRLHFKQLHCTRFGVKKVSSQSLTTSWAKEAFLDRRKASDLALTVAVSFVIGSFCFFWRASCTCCRVSLKMKRTGSCRLAGTFRSRISMSEVLDLFSVQVWMTRSIPSLMLLVDSQCRVWDLESCFSQKSHLSDGILPSLCRSTLLISNPFALLMLTENH